jgi:hypothetical protein
MPSINKWIVQIIDTGSEEFFGLLERIDSAVNEDRGERSPDIELLFERLEDFLGWRVEQRPSALCRAESDEELGVGFYRLSVDCTESPTPRAEFCMFALRRTFRARS